MSRFEDEPSWVFPDHNNMEVDEVGVTDEQQSVSDDSDNKFVGEENDNDSSSDDVSSTEEMGYSSFLMEKERNSNAATAALFDVVEDGSCSLFLDSVDSSTHYQRNDDENISLWDDFQDEPLPYINKRVQPEPLASSGSMLTGVSTTRIGSLPNQSLLAVSPGDFGGSGNFNDNDDRPIEMLEVFQDEPVPSDHMRSLVSSDNCSGVESLPDDEYDTTSETRKSLAGTIKSIVPQRTGRRLGLILFLVGLLILLITGVTIGVTKNTKQDEETLSQSLLTPKPTPSPTRVPVRSSSIIPIATTPTISLPPFGQNTVIVPVLNDGYINLGGIILRDMEVQHTTTLLVQDGYHLTAAVSVIEFDTATTLAPPSVIIPWITSAIIQLTVASHADMQESQNISLYARLYPNDIATQPDMDINQYGFGEIDFDDGWIAFKIIPNETTTVEIDATTFFRQQYVPTQNEGDNWDNIKVLLAHDNSDGTDNRGAVVMFHSSEAASIEHTPRLILDLEPPGLSKSPAPSTSRAPSPEPTVSPRPSSSSLPSYFPSVSPSLRPSSSWGPTYHPTISPSPTIISYPICSVCGDRQFGNPKAIVTNFSDLGNFRPGTQSNKITCGILHEIGLAGEIPPKPCGQLQARVIDTCCLPPDDDVFICNLCDDSSALVINPDAVVSLPVVGEIRTCGEYQARASAGEIPPFVCAGLRPFTSSTCCDIVL